MYIIKNVLLTFFNTGYLCVLPVDLSFICLKPLSTLILYGPRTTLKPSVPMDYDIATNPYFTLFYHNCKFN